MFRPSTTPATPRSEFTSTTTAGSNYIYYNDTQILPDWMIEKDASMEVLIKAMHSRPEDINNLLKAYLFAHDQRKDANQQDRLFNEIRRHCIERFGSNIKTPAAKIPPNAPPRRSKPKPIDP